MKWWHEELIEDSVYNSSLGFSTTVFCCCSAAAFLMLILSRFKLGGPLKFKCLTVVFLICLWLTYLSLTSLEAYGVIMGF